MSLDILQQFSPGPFMVEKLHQNTFEYIEILIILHAFNPQKGMIQK